MPCVSIIIPVYNSQNTLERCLSSISDQTLKDIEVIIIDDGSVDRSDNIIEHFCEKDSRFMHRYQQNSGVSSARNFGLQLANGEYIAFVDSDDWIESVFCEKMYSIATKNDLDVVHCRRIDEYEDKSILQLITQEVHIKIVDFEHFVPSEEDFYGTCWSYLFKREKAKEAHFDNGISFAEDALYSMQVMSIANRIGIVNEFLYHYSMMGNNTLSRGEFDERKYSLLDSRKKQLRMVKSDCAKGIMRARLADACMFLFLLGRESKLFNDNYYKEVNTTFKKNFFQWNHWRTKSVFKRMINYFYFLDLRFGYKMIFTIKKLMNR